MLAEAGRATPRLDAEVMLASFLKVERLDLWREPERTLEETDLPVFSSWVARRAAGEPVAYIVGHKEFWSLDFEVNREVLIPRPETEVLVEEVLKVAPQEGIRVLDLGVGSGAIVSALACELPRASFVATDISWAALAVAARNAERHGTRRRIRFICGDLFVPLKGRFDIIVSNPPYIAAEEFTGLPVGVRDYEPRMALVGGPDGLSFLRRIILEASPYLNPGGWLFVEMGVNQQAAVEGFLVQAGFDDIDFRRDYGGTIRVARGRKVEKSYG